MKKVGWWVTDHNENLYGPFHNMCEGENFIYQKWQESIKGPLNPWEKYKGNFVVFPQVVEVLDAEEL